MRLGVRAVRDPGLGALVPLGAIHYDTNVFCGERTMSLKTLAMIEEHSVKWVDLRFTDPRGKEEQHTTFPAKVVDEDFMTNGAMFDGSSIAGWKGTRVGHDPHAR